MTFRKVVGNLERFFDKNLTDLVRGIRNNKENEVNMRPFILIVIAPAFMLFYRFAPSGLFLIMT